MRCITMKITYPFPNFNGAAGIKVNVINNTYVELQYLACV